MTTSYVLEPVGRLDAGHLLGFLGAHAIPGVESWDGVTYARSLDLLSGPAVVEFQSTGAGALTITAHGSRPDDPALNNILRHLTAMDDDSTAAERFLIGDPLLRALVCRRPGIRLPGSVDHVETLVTTIIGQQVSLAGARVTAGRVVEAAGTPLPQGLRDAAPGVTRLFPTADALAGLNPEGLPMPRARGRSIVAVAAALAADPELSADDDGLLALPGVGPWTVAYHRLRTRRDPDVFLPTDLAVRRQIELMGVDPQTAGALSERWAPFRSTALLHLWAAHLATRRVA